MTKDTLPNFLIVGMAKCGTSSLSQYLQQHPDIFISKQKEPRFITSQCMSSPLGGPKDDKVEDWYVKNYGDYAKLFANATEKAIGEASADTLYFHKDTIPVVQEYFGDPKIIIILRNPIKRAFSAYQHLIRDARESLSFEEGLALEKERIQKNYELIYFYRDASRYYEPISAYMNAFSHVKVIINDDLEKNPKETLEEVFDFLKVDSHFEVETDLKFNVSGRPKNRALHETLQGENIIRKMIRPLARLLFPSEKSRTGAVHWLFIDRST